MIGWQIGMLIGLVGAGVTIVILMANIWIRIFSAVGMFSAALGTLYGIVTTWKQYKMFRQLTDEVKPEETKLEETK